jgi:Predicted pPIWI-associating nuclease
MEEWQRKIIEQQEMFRRLAEGPLKYVRDNQAMFDKASALLGANTPDYSKRFATIQLQARLPELGLTAALTKETFSSFALTDSIREMQSFADVHRDVYTAMERAALPYKQIADQVQAMSRYYDFTHTALAGLDYDRIGELISATDVQRKLVGRSTLALEWRNADLLASLNQPEGRLASAPPFVSELSAAGLFIHSRAVRSITPPRPGAKPAEQDSTAARVELVTETIAFLELALPQLKPAYLVQYRGAKARAKDRGPDWSTQGGASMRKLLKGVLHSVAPDDVVRPWAVKNKKELDKVGRPTRATKIDWLCECYPHDEYRSTVKMELISALHVLKLLNETQHEDDTPEFDQQYDEIVGRVEVAVRHILTIWKARTMR